MKAERVSWFWGAGALGLLCVVAAGGLRVAGADLTVGPLLVRWYYFLLVAAFALAGMAALSARLWVQTLGVIAIVAGWAITCLAVFVVLVAGTAQSTPTQRVDAPQGSPYLAVVRESHQLIDTMYHIRIESPWPVGPSWYVGCVNGDYQELVDLSWRSPTELAVTVDPLGDGQQTVVVSVDQLTGRVSGDGSTMLGFC
ncbi:MAG: hypothetical protein QM779_08475 [Propionicimonas sp.]|uniref:hypothetical protein n=1 Tax=Propionicimonas sp. TaxID=1955623 RepID=UPI003D0CD7C3